MSDLTERELINKLASHWTCPDGYHKNPDECSQAFTQLVKIVEGHFKYKYLDNDPECYHVADQEQGVDEEKIEAIVDMVDFSILPRRWSKKDIELVVRYTAKELLTRQPAQVDEDIEKLIEWLEKRVNARAMLQVSHPHLAWYPTDEDKENWQKVKQLLTQKRMVKG